MHTLTHSSLYLWLADCLCWVGKVLPHRELCGRTPLVGLKLNCFSISFSISGDGDYFQREVRLTARDFLSHSDLSRTLRL